MQSLMVISKKYFWDKDGKPLAFGKIYIHKPGTTDPLPTFTTAAGTVANAYPVVLNGEGYASIYLNGPYDIVVDDSVDANIWTDDDVPTENAEEWQDCIVPTYISSTSFKISGDFTTEYDIGRRVRVDNDVATFAYSAVKTSSFGASETTIVLTDAIVLPGIIQACAGIVGLNSLPSDPSLSTQAKTTHNMGSDADYTLTTIQAQNAIIEITDTGALLTAPRNIVVPDSAREWTFINSTAQVITPKTAAGTGVPVDVGATAHVFSDDTNVLNQEEPYTANAKTTHEMASDADYTLTAGQAQNAVVEITDTGVVLTVARNIIVPDAVRKWIFTNSTAQILTPKTAAGTGFAVSPGLTLSLHSDGVNVDLSTIKKASQAKVDAGLEGDEYVTPETLANKPTGSSQIQQTVYPAGTTSITPPSFAVNAFVELWSGGASGARIVTGTTVDGYGGQGGAYRSFFVPSSWLTKDASFLCSIGLGGAPVTAGSNTAGNDGEDTTITADNWLGSAGDVSTTGTGISFVAPNVINDSANDLGSFSSGDKIRVSGSTSNNETYTVDTAIAGTITTIEGTIVNESAGATILIRKVVQISPDTKGGVGGGVTTEQTYNPATTVVIGIADFEEAGGHTSLYDGIDTDFSGAGGASSDDDDSGTGGTSVFGGDGGDSSESAGVDGEDGVIPGGGSGAAANDSPNPGESGQAGDGQIRITWMG